MRTSFEGVSEPHRRELQRTLQRARAGKERCTAFLATVLESPGDWRMTPLLATVSRRWSPGSGVSASAGPS